MFSVKVLGALFWHSSFKPRQFSQINIIRSKKWHKQYEWTSTTDWHSLFKQGLMVASILQGASSLSNCQEGDKVHAQGEGQDQIKDASPDGPHRGKRPPSPPFIRLARSRTPRGRQRQGNRAYTYVILGEGSTAQAAVEGILSVDPSADILLLSSEAQMPRIDMRFRRATLGSDLRSSYNEWRRHIAPRLEENGFGGAAALERTPLTVLLAKGVHHINLEKRSITMDGMEIFYDRLLLAQPGRPRPFYVLDSEKSGYTFRDRINTLTKLPDFMSLESLIEEKRAKHVTVVGGGFLGTEVALALAKRARNKSIRVMQVFAEEGPLFTNLPPYLSAHLLRLLEKAGVEAVPEHIVTGLVESEGAWGDYEPLKLALMGEDRKEVETDYVVLATTHVDPNCALAGAWGLEVDPVNNGVVVNANLEALGGVYAAGSNASYYDLALGRRRVDRFDHSINSGFLAGKNMARTAHHSQHLHQAPQADSIGSKAEVHHKVNPFPGKQEMYIHQPQLKSSMTDIGVEVEVVGDINSQQMETVGLWVVKDVSARSYEVDQDPSESASQPLVRRATRRKSMESMYYQRGIVYYMKNNKIMGILLWNASDLLDRAREMLRRQPAIDSIDNLKRQLPLAPEYWLHVKQTRPCHVHDHHDH